MPEGKNNEYKSCYIETIKRTIIAFANTDGGTIYIGMDDQGCPVGVSDVDDTMLRVTSMVRDAIRPDVTRFVECTHERMNDKDVVVVTVQRGSSRPYYLHGKGIRPEGVYIRHGAATIPASKTAILDMIRETSGDCYETSRSLQQTLTFDTAASYFDKRSLEFGDQQKRTLHLINTDDTYSNLALLLSEQCPATMKVAVFQGTEKSVFRDRCELSGSLLHQLEEAAAYIDRYNRTRSEIRGLERIDTRDYPVEAVREALLNAVVHRDYAFRAPTLISIFDDRLEMVTMGGLPTGLDEEDILLGVSLSRNQYLANVFYRLHLIEAYGTGLLKIRECYADAPVQPQIQVSGHAFKITLPNRNHYREQQSRQAPAEYSVREFSPSCYASYIREPQSIYSVSGTNEMSSPHHASSTNNPHASYRSHAMTQREQQIYQLFEQTPHIVRKDVEEALQVSQATAILLLREMVEKGLLIKRGGGRQVRYYPGKH